MIENVRMDEFKILTTKVDRLKDHFLPVVCPHHQTIQLAAKDKCKAHHV